MSVTRLFGLALLVVGAILLYFGWQSTEALSEKVVEGLTGRYSDTTMGYLIGGAASGVLGLGLLVFGKRR